MEKPAQRLTMCVTTRLHYTVLERATSLQRNSSPDSTFLLRQEIMLLLEKGAIEELPPTQSRVFTAGVLLYPKKMVVYVRFWTSSLEPGIQSEQVQDANCKVHFVSNPTKRLVCDHRSKRCIFSHPDRQETQEIPQVRFRGQSLPVLCSSVLAGSGPPNVHKVYGHSSGPTLAPGCPNIELPRRLADLNSIAGSGADISRLSA